MKKFSNVVVVDESPKIYFYESGVKDVYKWGLKRADGVVTTLDIPRKTQVNFIINKVLATKKGNIFYNGCVYFIYKDMISELGELFETEGLFNYKPHTALQIQKKAKGLMVLSVGKILRTEATHAMKLPKAISKEALLKQDYFIKRLIGKDTYNCDIEELQDALGAKPLSLDEFKYFYTKELDSVPSVDEILQGWGVKTDQPAQVAEISDENRSEELLPWEDEEKWIEEVTNRKKQLIVNSIEQVAYEKEAFKSSKVEETADEDAEYNMEIDKMIAEHNRMITKLKEMKR